MNEHCYAVISVVAIFIAVIAIVVAVLLAIKFRNLKKSYEKFKEEVKINNHLYFSGH